MATIIDFAKEKEKREPKEITITKEDIQRFWEEQELWDRFYDYVGEMIEEGLSDGTISSDKDVQEYGYKSIEDFKNNWRGNSEEEYQKWLIENGYR